ncbi:hypothetical protein [Iodobacter fluviatilis]|nr:hypothetical protein [Iodobacter fluviatilis]
MENLEKHFLPEDDLLEKYEQDVLVVARRRVIKVLYGLNEPISLVDLMERANISINSLAAVYSELCIDDILVMDDYKFELTNKGRLWAIKNRKKLFMRKNKFIYKNVLELNSKEISAERFPSKYLFSWVDIKRA